MAAVGDTDGWIVIDLAFFPYKLAEVVLEAGIDRDYAVEKEDPGLV